MMTLKATTSGPQVPEARPSTLKNRGLTVRGRRPGRQDYEEQLNAYRGESSLSRSPGEFEATVSRAISPSLSGASRSRLSSAARSSSPSQRVISAITRRGLPTLPFQRCDGQKARGNGGQPFSRSTTRGGSTGTGGGLPIVSSNSS